jgi:hypothetical protein
MHLIMNGISIYRVGKVLHNKDQESMAIPFMKYLD